MKITVKQWIEKSRRGEVCGILGCPETPIWDCPRCKNSYCTEHKQLHERMHQIERIHETQ